jgi:hypothetical protein
MNRRHAWAATIYCLLCDVVALGRFAVTSRAQLVAETCFAQAAGPLPGTLQEAETG